MIVVQNIFFFTFGLVGADDGVPSTIDPISSCVFKFNGNKMNKVRNQITANNTKAADIVMMYSPLYFFQFDECTIEIVWVEKNYWFSMSAKHWFIGAN